MVAWAISVVIAGLVLHAFALPIPIPSTRPGRPELGVSEFAPSPVVSRDFEDHPVLLVAREDAEYPLPGDGQAFLTAYFHANNLAEFDGLHEYVQIEHFPKEFVLEFQRQRGLNEIYAANMVYERYRNHGVALGTDVKDGIRPSISGSKEASDHMEKTLFPFPFRFALGRHMKENDVKYAADMVYHHHLHTQALDTNNGISRLTWDQYNTLAHFLDMQALVAQQPSWTLKEINAIKLRMHDPLKPAAHHYINTLLLNKQYAQAIEYLKTDAEKPVVSKKKQVKMDPNPKRVRRAKEVADQSVTLAQELIDALEAKRKAPATLVGEGGNAAGDAEPARKKRKGPASGASTAGRRRRKAT